MRFVVKNEKDKTKKLSSKETYEKIKNLCLNKDKDLISDNVYRDAYDTKDGKRSKVEDQLAISYHNKCAYCERICKADIEHYRPKKKVSNEEDHDGYYWLCYEWSNLIPSCITCNRDGGKHNKFPILGTRVNEPPKLLNDNELDLDKFKANNHPLIDEIPYLLHPEVDDPLDFFEFEIAVDFKGIRIVGIDSHDRGEKTIEICKLNRQELLLDRQKNVIDNFTNAVKSIFVKNQIRSNNHKKFICSLEHCIETLFDNADDIEITHTLLRKYIVASVDNFSKIVLPFIDNDNLKNIIKKVFILRACS